MIALKGANYLGNVEQSKADHGIIACITSYPDTHFSGRLHYHETLHMSFVLKGGSLEKRKQREVQRLPGKVTFYEAGEPHQSTSIYPGSSHLNLEITDAFLQQQQINASALCPENLIGRDAQFLMLKVYKELLWYDSDSGLIMESAVMNLLQLSERQNLYKTKPLWVNKVDQLLHDRWDEVLTLTELAQVAQLHPVNLSAYFSRYFGCTIGEYRRKIKIEHAVSLMSTSAHSLTQIAFLCGFSDQSHFIRTFKQLTGWIPKSYQMLNCQ